MFDYAGQQTSEEGRIPSSLLDLYVRYKQDTRAVITWLVSHRTSRYKNRQTLSIRDLFSLAEIVKSKAVEMPKTVDFHFREAIAARTQLSKFFRRASSQGVGDQETSNHEYFNASLTKIYTDLCGCHAKPEDKRTRAHASREPGDHVTASQNRFKALCSDQDHPGHDCSLEDELCDSQGGVDARESKAGRSDLPPPRLADDILGEAFELRKEIQEMDDLLTATQRAWEQAARGEISLVVATFVSHSAFAAFEEIEIRLKTLCDISDPEVLRSKFMQMDQDLGVPINDEDGSRSPAKRLVEALQKPWYLLLRMKGKGPERRGGEALSTFERSSHLVLRKSTDPGSTDDECLKVMLQNIGLHLQATYLNIGIIRVGTPVYSEVGYFLTHRENDSNCLQCSYGLRLLLESCKSYWFALQPTAAPSCCRLQALQFAQEAISSVCAVLNDSTMPCRCRGTLAYHLENLHLDFKGFLKIKAFDLYFQSPWVSGSHILEMLEALFGYGLRLFSYRTYVGSVLHVYNVLQQFTDLQSIPLLENLCNTFSDIIFPGGRSCRNFKACYIRSMGGRLRFNSYTSDHKSGCHSMTIPAHTAKATAGFRLRHEPNDPRFDSQKISLLHHIKRRGYHPNDATWDRVYKLSSTDEGRLSQKTMRKHSCFHHGPLEHELFSRTAQHRLQRLQTAIHTECSGAFPTAKINFFEVYLACVRIISLVSDRYHGDRARRGQNCLCFADTILSAADRCRNNEHRLQPFGCEDLVGTCQEALTEVLGERVLGTFLWKGL